MAVRKKRQPASDKTSPEEVKPAGPIEDDLPFWKVDWEKRELEFQERVRAAGFKRLYQSEQAKASKLKREEFSEKPTITDETKPSLRKSGPLEQSLKSLKKKIFGDRPEPKRRSKRSDVGTPKPSAALVVERRRPAARSPANDFLRDGSKRNVVPSKTPEPLPLEQPKAPAEKGAVRLEDIPYEILLAEVERRKLKAAFSASTPPTVAPKPWADNTEGLTATAFVATEYASAIEAGVLSLKALRDRDPDLAKAYSNRIYRYPNEAVALVRATRSDRIEDPQEAIDRFREASRKASEKRRASQKDASPDGPK